MKKFLLFLIGTFLLVAGTSGLRAATSGDTPEVAATLSSLSGKVTLKNPAGKQRKGLVGSKAYEGETVKVGKDGKATLTLFDGSALELGANTQLVLKTLKKPSEKEKKLKFKLSFGQLVAKVKKLLTPTSSFEVEAGGAICGVRGTQYNISYDPETNKVTVKVTEGSVYFNLDGTTYIVKAGESISFTNGQQDKLSGQNPTGSNGPSGSDGGNGDNGDNGGSLGSLGRLGNTPPGKGGALGDLNDQFVGGVVVNGDNNFTDPAVGGTVKVNINAGIPVGEAAP